MRIENLEGSDEPVCQWEYDGSSYRLSIVGGLTRFEQQLKGNWYLIRPSHDTTAMMICAEQLANRLHEAENSIMHLRGERFRRVEADR